MDRDKTDDEGFLINDDGARVLWKGFPQKPLPPRMKAALSRVVETMVGDCRVQPLPDGWDMTDPTHLSLPGVLGEVAQERVRQLARWGVQDHEDGTGRSRGLSGLSLSLPFSDLEEAARDHLNDEGVSWAPILLEEVGEALVESDPVNLRAELVQVAAVAVAWIQCLDRNVTPPAPEVPASPHPLQVDDIVMLRDTLWRGRVIEVQEGGSEVKVLWFMAANNARLPALWEKVERLEKVDGGEE